MDPLMALYQSEITKCKQCRFSYEFRKHFMTIEDFVQLI